MTFIHYFCYIVAGALVSSVMGEWFAANYSVKFLENRIIVLLIGVCVFIHATALASEDSFAKPNDNATVDLRKVFDGFYKTKLAYAEMKERVKPFDKKDLDMKINLRKEIINYSNLVASANEPLLTTDERDRRKQAAAYKLKEIDAAKTDISKFEKDSKVMLTAMRNKIRDDLMEQIFTVVNSRDKAHRYTFDQFRALATENKSSAKVLISIDTGEKSGGGIVDLTNSILAQLNANAPAGTP